MKLGTDHHSLVGVLEISDADGIMFFCPKCYAVAGGKTGVHSLVLFTPKVTGESPNSGRWELQGTSFDDLSLVGKPSSSVKCLFGCCAHFFVTNGFIDFCPDSWNDGTKPKEGMITPMPKLASDHQPQFNPETACGKSLGVFGLAEKFCELPKGHEAQGQKCGFIAAEAPAEKPVEAKAQAPAGEQKPGNK